MTTIPVVYAAEISGSDVVERKLQEINQLPRGLSGVMGDVGHSVKEVAKDLDNLGLSAGKSFTLAAEGAFSVATALASGGVAGAVGALTVGVGYLAQAWSDHNKEVEAAKKATENLKTAEKDRWDAAIKYLKEYRGEQKEKTTADLEDIARAREAEVIYLQATQNRIKAQMLMERVGSDERNRLAAEVKAYTDKIAEAVEKRDEAMHEAGLARDMDAANSAQERENRIEARRRAAAEMRKKERDKEAAEFKKKQEELARELAAMNAESDRREREDAADEEALLQRRIAAWEKAKEAELDAQDKLTDAKRQRALDSYNAMLATREETEAMRAQNAEADRMAASYFGLSVASESYSTVLSNTLTPAINGISDATRELAAINWETFDQYQVTTRDILPMFLQRAQAELFSMAITSAGAAAQKSAEAVGYAATGAGMMALGMPNANGMFAAAAGAAVSAGLHASFAAAHGAAAVGVQAAGFGLAGAGVAGFTREDTERRGGRSQTGLPGLSRLTGTGDGSTTGGGTVGGGGGGGTTYNQTVVLDYSNALVLDPDDQRRAQRVWNEVQAANNRDGWGTL